jgi:Na+-transporting methylmalonyl-CoA/oxaloacetate decarboxylase gamma subunit
MIKFTGKVIIGTVLVLITLIFLFVGCMSVALDDTSKESVSTEEVVEEIKEPVVEQQTPEPVVEEMILQPISFEFVDSNEEWGYTNITVTIDNQSANELSFFDYEIYVILEDGTNVRFDTVDNLLIGKTKVGASSIQYYTKEQIVDIMVRW